MERVTNEKVIERFSLWEKSGRYALAYMEESDLAKVVELCKTQNIKLTFCVSGRDTEACIGRFKHPRQNKFYNFYLSVHNGAWNIVFCTVESVKCNTQTHVKVLEKIPAFFSKEKIYDNEFNAYTFDEWVHKQIMQMSPLEV